MRSQGVTITTRPLRAGAVALGLGLMLVTSAGGTAKAACGQHWVASWAAAPSDAALSRAVLLHQTLRMIIAPHLGGGVLRIHLSNRFGALPIELGPVTVGLRAGGASLVDGSERGVSFSGAPMVTIPAGGEVTSDPVSLSFHAFDDLAVSVSVSGLIVAPTEHHVTRQTSYITPVAAGDHAADASGDAFTQTTEVDGTSSGWYLLDGLDVIAPGSTGAVVTFGDSITDGFEGSAGSFGEGLGSIDADGRYPDDLQRRIMQAGLPLSVANAGVSGNRLLHPGILPAYGPSGLSRFGADVLSQAGATDVIVLEGINDFGQGTGITAPDLIAGYQDLISEAHAAGVRIQLGTLTPTTGARVESYGGVVTDLEREAVNQWIRSQHLSDGIIDFDAAVRDPGDPTRIASPLDSSDHVHLDLAGYRAMADAVDLGLLGRPSCGLPNRHRPGHRARTHDGRRHHHRRGHHR
jgi:lysophospholipase L1-like esterase